MDHRQPRQDEQVVIAERAAEWLMRLNAGGVQDKRAFARWLKRSPEHVGETLLATSTDIVLRQFFRGRNIDPMQFSSSGEPVIDLPQSTRQSVQERRRNRRWPWVTGLGAGLAAGVTALILQPSLIRDWLNLNVYTTSIGEQRSIELDDGSVISINTQSSIRVKFTARTRDVYLEAGQALFTVAKEASRPFRVHAGESIVQAIGTKFDVWRRPREVSVAVIEGAVQVRAHHGENRTGATMMKPAPPTRVTAGEAISIANTGQITTRMPVDVANISAWQQRRLVFSQDTLVDIVEEFSRYNRRPRLIIEGDALRDRRLSGVFDADYPEALLIYLAADEMIAIDRRGDEIVIRAR